MPCCIYMSQPDYWMPCLWMPWDTALCRGVALRLPERGGLIKCQFQISVSKQWTVHCPAKPHRLSGYCSQKPPATLHPPKAQFCLYCISKARCLRMCWAGRKLFFGWWVNGIPSTSFISCPLTGLEWDSGLSLFLSSCSTCISGKWHLIYVFKAGCCFIFPLSFPRKSFFQNWLLFALS